MIKVLIADDHAILRQGLKQMLLETDDIAVVNEAENASRAYQLALKEDADVLLLDISLPDRSGIEVLKLIKNEKPKLAVLMLSAHREDQYAIRALKAGASGYLSKEGALTELVIAIRTVAKGKKYVGQAVAEALANHLYTDSDKPAHETLSDREFQTLTLLASGLRVSDIALKLSLSVKTISMYRSRLLAKLNLKNNAELTHYAIFNKLV
jgi:two-component system invasion response regulator UvrY